MTTIDFIQLLQKNYSNDIFHFERLVQAEMNIPVNLFVENNKIKVYHKITGREMGEYIPSENFNKLSSAFIIINKPSFSFKDLEEVRAIFKQFNIHKSILDAIL